MSKKDVRYFNRNVSVKLLLILIFSVTIWSCGSSSELELAGTLERRTLEVSAPISEIIVDLPVKVGEPIKKDAIIVQLDTEVVAAELNAHEAALAAAQALLKDSAGQFDRQAKLRRAQVTSTQAYDAAKRKMDEARAMVAEKEARIVQAKKRLKDLTIRSRISGVLDQLPYEIGERVPAGGVVAVVIAADNPWVRVWLPARAVIHTKPGKKAKVRVEGLDQWFDAKVLQVSLEPEFTPHYALTERESAHLSYETRVQIVNPKKDLPPGLPAWVRIPLDKE